MGKIDLTGQTFSFLTVLEDNGTRTPDRRVKWKCQCVCGNITHVTTTYLMNHRIKSCGCKRTELMHLGQIKDITGQTFGKLTALYRLDSEKRSKWHCRCECGNECDVFLGNLTRLHTTSCGCQNKSIGENNIKEVLERNNIKYIYDSPYFKNLYTSKNRLGRYDFILLDDNDSPYRIIEFDGRQHYNGKFWYEPFETRKERDEIKNQYAFSHNIPIIRIPYTERDNITLDLLLGDKYLLKREVDNV